MAVEEARDALSRVSARCVDNCQRYIRAGFLITPPADPRTIMANAFSPRSRIEPNEISLSAVSSARDVLRVLVKLYSHFSPNQLVRASYSPCKNIG